MLYTSEALVTRLCSCVSGLMWLMVPCVCVRVCVCVCVCVCDLGTPLSGMNPGTHAHADTHARAQKTHLEPRNVRLPVVDAHAEPKVGDLGNRAAAAAAVGAQQHVARL